MTAEIESMKKVHAALVNLSIDERARVLAWTGQKFDDQGGLLGALTFTCDLMATSMRAIAAHQKATTAPSEVDLKLYEVLAGTAYEVKSVEVVR